MASEKLSETAKGSIKKYGMIKRGESLIVSVSGGPDSTALLLFLTELAKVMKLNLHVWHLNHLIRPEAGKESEHVRRLAENLGLNCTVEARDVKNYAKENKLIIQESGRQIRYGLLEKLRCCLGFDKIAVGHNADDNVETFFINLCRGADLKGLGGIPPVNEKIIRPLIETERSKIRDYLREKHLAFLDDKSNMDRRYLRNRVRLELLPILKTFNPAFIKRMMVTIELIRDDDDWLDGLTKEKFASLVKIGKDEVKIEADDLRRTEPALSRRLIRMAIGLIAGDEKNIDFEAIKAVIDNTLLRNQDVVLARGAGATMSGSRLVIFKSSGPINSVSIEKEGGVFEIDAGPISVTIASKSEVDLPPNAGAQYVDFDKISWPVTIGSWEQGD